MERAVGNLHFGGGASCRFSCKGPIDVPSKQEHGDQRGIMATMTAINGEKE
jgi:hypothetical protein